MPGTMRQYRIARQGSLDGLVAGVEEVPECGPRDLLVRVMANSLNYRDLAILLGHYGGPPVRERVVPLSDGAGIVVATGRDVSGYNAGDRVIGLFRQNWLGGRMPLRALDSDLGGSRDGMLSEYVVLGEEGVSRVPAYLGYEEAATLPCAALTAWNAATVGGPVAPGETVLVIGSGGVSLFALQFARALGATVIAVTSSQGKVERLLDAGADHVVCAAGGAGWEKQVLELTGGRGVDRVFETGGSGTLARSMEAAAVQARIVLIGVLAGNALIDPLPILLKRLTVTAISTGSRQMQEDMLRAMEAWNLRPVIDARFPFEDARDAYGYLRTGGHFGKVVIGRDYSDTTGENVAP